MPVAFQRHDLGYNLRSARAILDAHPAEIAQSWTRRSRTLSSTTWPPPAMNCIAQSNNRVDSWGGRKKNPCELIKITMCTCSIAFQMPKVVHLTVSYYSHLLLICASFPEFEKECLINFLKHPDSFKRRAVSGLNLPTSFTCLRHRGMV